MHYLNVMILGPAQLSYEGIFTHVLEPIHSWHQCLTTTSNGGKAFSEDGDLHEEALSRVHQLSIEGKEASPP